MWRSGSVPLTKLDAKIIYSSQNIHKTSADIEFTNPITLQANRKRPQRRPSGLKLECPTAFIRSKLFYRALSIPGHSCVHNCTVIPVPHMTCDSNLRAVHRKRLLAVYLASCKIASAVHRSLLREGNEVYVCSCTFSLTLRHIADYVTLHIGAVR
jgi:hypothetical protein